MSNLYPHEISILNKVGDEMSAYWEYLVLPIVGVRELSHPKYRMRDRLIGTGTLVKFGVQHLLLTVRHVANEAEKFSVVNFGNENGIGIVNILTNKSRQGERIPPLRLGIPNNDTDDSKNADPDARRGDIAIMAVDESQVKIIDGPVSPHTSVTAFESPRTKERDIYWFAGFPGAKANFTAFGNKLGIDRHVTYESLVPPSFSWFDDEVHFCIQHGPSGKNARGEDVHRVLPHGLSGSTIWKTNFTEAGSSEWRADKARVIALATNWDKNTSTIVGTRVEVLTRAFEYVPDWLSGSLVGGYKPAKSKHATPQK